MKAFPAITIVAAQPAALTAFEDIAGRRSLGPADPR